jgi:hypothetical protein
VAGDTAKAVEASPSLVLDKADVSASEEEEESPSASEPEPPARPRLAVRGRRELDSEADDGGSASERSEVPDYSSDDCRAPRRAHDSPRGRRAGAEDAARLRRAHGSDDNSRVRDSGRRARGRGHVSRGSGRPRARVASESS